MTFLWLCQTILIYNILSAEFSKIDTIEWGKKYWPSKEFVSLASFPPPPFFFLLGIHVFLTSQNLVIWHTVTTLKQNLYNLARFSFICMEEILPKGTKCLVSWQMIVSESHPY